MFPSIKDVSALRIPGQEADLHLLTDELHRCVINVTAEMDGGIPVYPADNPVMETFLQPFPIPGFPDPLVCTQVPFQWSLPWRPSGSFTGKADTLRQYADKDSSGKVPCTIGAMSPKRILAISICSFLVFSVSIDLSPLLFLQHNRITARVPFPDHVMPSG